MTSVDWVGEYQTARERIWRMVEGLDDGPTGSGARVPACPDWTVRELVSHLTGMAAALGAGEFPSGDTQVWLDGLVSSRRDRSIDALVDEWRSVSPSIDAFLQGMGSAGGQLVYDVVAHEHDICMALGRTGDRDSTGVHACASAMSSLLERDLVAAGLPAVRVTSGGRTWDVGPGDPGLEIELDPFELIRVFGSRRSEAQMRALPWKGELDRYLPALSHLPLPTTDLHE